MAPGEGRHGLASRISCQAIEYEADDVLMVESLCMTSLERTFVDRLFVVAVGQPAMHRRIDVVADASHRAVAEDGVVRARVRTAKREGHVLAVRIDGRRDLGIAESMYSQK